MTLHVIREVHSAVLQAATTHVRHMGTLCSGHCLVYMLPLSILAVMLACVCLFFPPAPLCLAKLTELSVLLQCHVEVSMSE